jgi:large subunit ribosomal protein L29
MKTRDFIKEISGLAESDLGARARSLAEECMRLRFKLKAGQPANSGFYRNARRNIARVLTLQRQKRAAGVPSKEV